jgi:cell division GTPase FtsZ
LNVNILMLSLGGGGGNILRSVKALYRRDLAVTEQADPTYAARLNDSVATRFVDTNRFSLMDIPEEERVMIGAATTRHLGAGHDPEVARRAFEESKGEIAQLIAGYSTVILIATGGKGTGTGTMLPAVLLARQQRKLVIPIFVRPSFERHEVEKRRYDQALDVSRQLDAAQIRFIELLNDRGYVDADPQPQSVVWERMNVPIARALRGLLYVLWDLSQVDPSDLSALFAGPGRLRIGFSELAPQPGSDPSDETVDEAVQKCWDNAFCNFSGPVGTSLICIQGPWSNVADAKIKSGIASQAVRAGSTVYNPLYARASQMPQPWGVTVLCAEHTGSHPPIDVDWSLEPPVAAIDLGPRESVVELAVASRIEFADDVPPAPPAPFPSTRPTSKPALFENFWDLALAINRSDAGALDVAQNGANASVRVDPTDLRKLLGTVWFRSVFPRLSNAWRERLLSVLVETVIIPDHVLKLGRREIRMRDIGLAELKELFSKSSLNEAVRGDVRLLLAVGNLWGAESLSRIHFAGDAPAPEVPSKLALMMQGFRRV